MDAAERQKIISGVSKTISKVNGLEPVTETVEHNKIYEYKSKLKQIHAFEKVCKEDSENWTDENWNAFESWMNKDNSTKLSPDLAAIVEAEESRKKAVEAAKRKIIEGIKGAKW